MGTATPDGDTSLQLHILATDAGCCERLVSSLRKGGEAITVTVQAPQAWNGTTDCDLLLVMDDGENLGREIRARHRAQQPGYPLLVACTNPGADDELPAGDLPGLVRALKPRLVLQRRELDNRRLVRQLHALTEQLARVGANSPAALAFSTAHSLLYCNDAFAALLGESDGKALVGTSLPGRAATPDRERLAAALQAGKAVPDLTLSFAGPGSGLPLQLAITPSLYKAQPCLLVEASPAHGESRQRRPADERDLITRLDNLPVFTSRLDAAINAAVQDDINSILLVARIDNFRRVQECIGRSATLHVLADIAGFLRDGISKPYTGSRLAPDEFGILLYDATPGDGARLAAYIAGKVNDSLLPASARDITLGLSTGLAVINRHSAGASTVINRARLNTGTARKHGTGSDPAGRPDALAARIGQALAAGRLALRFQPVVSMAPAAQPCFETTFLLAEADGSPLPGDDVLACANLHDLGKAIDKQVLDRLLKRDAKPCFQAALNSSSLACPGMPGWLAQRLHHYRGQTGRLQLLVSEIDLHSNRENVLGFCAALDSLGVGVVIIDFGGTFDPLPALAAIRPAGVRLDPALVRDLPYSTQQQRRLRKLITAVHHQRATVAVTALEDCTLLPLLFELGVDRVQGDCLQPPMNEPVYAFPTERVLRLPAQGRGKCP